VSANSTSFTVSITHADIASENETGATATVQPVAIVVGTASSALAAGSYSFLIQFIAEGGNTAGQLTIAQVVDAINSVSDGSPTIVSLPLGTVNFALEPMLNLQVGVTFGTSNANNSATLGAFSANS
jgi:hypothetical protein